MKRVFLSFSMLVLASPALAQIHVEAEDCTISSWDLSPPGAAVQIVVPPTQPDTIHAVEIVGGRTDAVGVGQLRLPGSIANGEYAVTLRYFTNRTYSGSEIAVQFGSYSGSVVTYDTGADWHTFYPDNSLSWYSWYDVELTASGCPFGVSSTEPMPGAVGIYDVADGDFYINVWDKTSQTLDLATIDYIEIEPVPIKSTDVNDDGYINLKDFSILADSFMLTTWAADLYIDGIVDVADCVLLADDWLKSALHVADISSQASETGCDAGSWAASFIVTVHNKWSVPVSGVEVTAGWTGVHGSEGTHRQMTNQDGQVFFASKCVPIAGDTTLTVMDLYEPGHAYHPGENVETSETAPYSVPWTPAVRAEDWIITAVDGDYAKVDGAGGKVVLVCTDGAGNPTHAMGDAKFSFSGAIPDGNYELTVHWYSGTMGATPWAYRLGTDAGSLTENGVTISTVDNWHYFYPGHSGSHSDQWFTHDYSGANPIDFAMWPNSPVSTSITASGIGQGDFYIRLRDMSPDQGNYFSIEYFELAPIP